MATRYAYEDGEDFSGSGYGKSKFSAATQGTTLADLGTYDLISSKYGPLQTFDAPLSNKGNATSQISGTTNTFAVGPQTYVRLVDNASGKVVYEGIGYDAAQKARDLAQGLTDESGRKANWDIQASSPGMSGYATVAHEAPNKSTLGKIGSVVGTALPIAMIPLTMGASAPLAGLGTAGTIGLGAGVGGLSAGLKGENILKGAVMGGVTSAGGQLLGGATGPLSKLGLSADVANAVGTGIGATGGGLATGRSLTDALKGGVMAGAGQYVASQLLAPNSAELEFQRNLSQNANNAIEDALASGMDYMDASLIDAGYYPNPTPSAAPSAAPSTSSFAVAPTVDPAMVVTGTRLSGPTFAGGSNLFTPARYSGDGPTPETVVTAQEPTVTEDQTSPFAVPTTSVAVPETVVTAQEPTVTEDQTSPFAVPTTSVAVPETVVTAQEPTVTEDKSLAVVPASTSVPETVVTAQEPTVTEDKSLAVVPASTSVPETVVTAKKDVVDLEDKPLAVNLDVASTLAGTGPKVTDKVVEPKSTTDKIRDYLKALGLGVGLFGNLAGGGGKGGSAGVYYPGRTSFDPIFSAKLPTPGTAGAYTVGGLGGTAGSNAPDARPTTDWYRYGMGPAMDIPAGTDLSKATSPYAGYGPGTLGEETYKQVTGMSHGGPMGYSRGSSRESFAVQGPGTGRSDDIPAVLSDGEYVIDAETVALLGDGSSRAGAKKLDDLRVKIRKHKGRNLAKGKFSVDAKHPEAYMFGGRI